MGSNGFYEDQPHDFNHKYQPGEFIDDFNFNQPDICNRPPSRQKEPSLALGIGSEYGEDCLDDEITNKISSEIVLTSGIPAPTNDFSSKYTPVQGKRNNTDVRPPSRHKTPTKMVGLDDIPDEPQTPPERDLFIGLNQNENNIEPYKSLEVKNDLIRKPNTNQAKRMAANQCTNFLENMHPLDNEKQSEVRNTFAHGFKNTNQKEYNLLDEVEPKNPNYQGTQWFFENSRKEEAKKDDSFVCINLHNIYEMEGTTPHDDCSHLIDENSESQQKMR